MEVKKSKSDFPSFINNPSWTLVKQIEQGATEEQFNLINKLSGEVTDFIMRKEGEKKESVVTVDRQPFIKLYLTSLEQMQMLSNSGIRMLTYILSILDEKTDTVKIDIEESIKFCRYSSRSAYYKGVVDLLERGFIFNKTGGKNNFHINVFFFYNGKRKKKEREQ